MAPVHLFSSNHDTVAHVATLLRSEFAIREHRLAERLPPPAEKEGGCIVFDMDEPNGWWRAMLAESIAKPSLPIVLVTAQPVVSDVVLAVQLGAKDVIARAPPPTRSTR
jgi:FixJ family two-component response regulator